MIVSEKIFFDTAPFIYLVEDHTEFSIPVRDFITDHVLFLESSLFTSSITLAEFFVKPKRDANQALIEKFKNKIKEFNFTVFDITVEIAEFSSDLRAKYDFLKAFDAIQLATAISYGCSKFVTNDQRLARIKEIDIVLVSNLKRK